MAARTAAMSLVMPFGELQRPARIGVLLGCPGGFVGPDLIGPLALLDRILLGLRVALLGRGYQPCACQPCPRHGRMLTIDDLPAHGEITPLLDLLVKGKKQRVQRASLGQLLAKQPDRVGIRLCSAPPAPAP